MVGVLVSVGVGVGVSVGAGVGVWASVDVGAGVLAVVAVGVWAVGSLTARVIVFDEADWGVVVPDTMLFGIVFVSSTRTMAVASGAALGSIGYSHIPNAAINASAAIIGPAMAA